MLAKRNPTETFKTYLKILAIFFEKCFYISMDESKIVELKIENNKPVEKCENDKKNNLSFHTNPILQKMFLANMNNKKDKFAFKDLFK